MLHDVLRVTQHESIWDNHDLLQLTRASTPGKLLPYEGPPWSTPTWGHPSAMISPYL